MSEERKSGSNGILDGEIEDTIDELQKPATGGCPMHPGMARAQVLTLRVSRELLRQKPAAKEGNGGFWSRTALQLPFLKTQGAAALLVLLIAGALTWGVILILSSNAELRSDIQKIMKERQRAERVSAEGVANVY